MYCPNCGKQADGAFCRYCGAKLPGQSAGNSKRAKQAVPSYSDIDFVPEDESFIPEERFFEKPDGLGDETVVLEPLDQYTPEEGPRNLAGGAAYSERTPVSETGAAKEGAKPGKKLGERMQNVFVAKGNLGRDPYANVDEEPEELWEDDDSCGRGSKTGGKKKKKKKAAKTVRSVGHTAGKTIGSAGKAVGKAGKAAGSAASGLISTVLRLACVVLMAGIIGFLGKEIWIERSVLGTLSLQPENFNKGEAVFLAMSGVTLLYGLVSLAWMASRRRMAYDGRLKKFDTGRGLTAFILFALLIFTASAIQMLLPYRAGILDGVNLYFSVAGSVTKTAGSCAVIGVVLCIVRKILK